MPDPVMDLWRTRLGEQQRLADLLHRRRQVFALYGDQADAQALDRLIRVSQAIIERCTERILDAIQNAQEQTVQQGTPQAQG